MIHSTSCYIYNCLPTAYLISSPFLIAESPQQCLPCPSPHFVVPHLALSVCPIPISFLALSIPALIAFCILSSATSAENVGVQGAPVSNPKLRTSIKPPFLAWFGQSHINRRMRTCNCMKLGNKQALISHMQKLVAFFSPGHLLKFIIVDLRQGGPAEYDHKRTSWSLPRCQTRFEEKIDGIQSSITGIQEGHYFSPALEAMQVGSRKSVAESYCNTALFDFVLELP